MLAVFGGKINSVKNSSHLIPDFVSKFVVRHWLFFLDERSLHLQTELMKIVHCLTSLNGRQICRLGRSTQMLNFVREKDQECAKIWKYAVRAFVDWARWDVQNCVRIIWIFEIIENWLKWNNVVIMRTACKRRHAVNQFKQTSAKTHWKSTSETKHFLHLNPCYLCFGLTWWSKNHNIC